MAWLTDCRQACIHDARLYCGGLPNCLASMFGGERTIPTPEREIGIQEIGRGDAELAEHEGVEQREGSARRSIP